MLLKDLLKATDQNIAILYFGEKGELKCEEYTRRQFKQISKKTLKREVMDIRCEEDCLEIWIY